VLPSPIQHFAHVAFGAPPPRDVILRAPAAARSPAHNHPGPSTSAPVRRQSAASSDPVSDKTHPGQFHGHLRKGNGAGPGYPSCVPVQATEQDHGRAVGHDKDPAQPSPAPNQLKSGSTQGPHGSVHGQDTASSPGWLALPTAACPGGTGPAKAAHAAGQ
jgi:hypothetical protein